MMHKIGFLHNQQNYSQVNLLGIYCCCKLKIEVLDLTNSKTALTETDSTFLGLT